MLPLHSRLSIVNIFAFISLDKLPLAAPNEDSVEQRRTRRASSRYLFSFVHPDDVQSISVQLLHFLFSGRRRVLSVESFTGNAAKKRRRRTTKTQEL